MLLVHKIKMKKYVFSPSSRSPFQNVYCPGTCPNDMQHLLYSQDGAISALTHLLSDSLKQPFPYGECNSDNICLSTV